MAGDCALARGQAPGVELADTAVEELIHEIGFPLAVSRFPESWDVDKPVVAPSVHTKTPRARVVARAQAAVASHIRLVLLSCRELHDAPDISLTPLLSRPAL